MLTLLLVCLFFCFFTYGISFIQRINKTVETVKDTVENIKNAKKSINETLDPNKPLPEGNPDETPNTENNDTSPNLTDNAAKVEGFNDGTEKLADADSLLRNAPPGAPIRSFLELGDMSGGYPQDIWLDNVALTIPPSNVGMTDIIFVDPVRPQQCYNKCKTSPFCRFFSYWQETGSCNLHQTLQNGETTPENMLRYAYTVPFSQHWVSGYVRKSGNSVPEESRL